MKVNYVIHCFNCYLCFSSLTESVDYSAVLACRNLLQQFYFHLKGVLFYGPGLTCVKYKIVGLSICSDRYLSLPTKVRVYQTLVIPVLTYACETWTLSAADTRRLEAFHMKCQRQIARIRWQDHIRNTEVTILTGLSPVSESIIRRRNSLLGHVTRLAEDTPDNQALRCHVDMTLGRFLDPSWRRRPGRPTNRWLDQFHGDNSSPADLWR